VSRTLGSAALGGVIGAGLLALTLALAGVFEDDDRAAAPATTATAAAVRADPNAVYERARGAIVMVRAEGVGEAGSEPEFGPPEDSPREATGSGFVIDRDVTIVTNAHVVGRSDDVTVRFSDDGKPIDARVIGRDRSTDLAVLKIDPDEAPRRLPTLALADSDRIKVGQQAIAIGTPFGLSQSITVGVVSGLSREIDAPDGFSIRGAIQTDAAVNPGNSGGPLLDANGRVIGVNTQARGENIGFAVPANLVKRIVPDLEQDGVVRRAYLGVSTTRATGGPRIVRTVPDGPADDAGLRRGDVITKVGAHETDDPGDLSAAVDRARPGDRVRVAIRRSGRTRTVVVRLGRRPTN
jgi:S1-C subfamily serine protease